MSDWRSWATLAVLRRRARLLALIRQFFAARDVLEVETPILSSAGTTDPHIASFSTTLLGGEGGCRTMYLHTSPEFAMKRLLASGAGSIYQIAKVFRNEERGRYHNPEFTLLEWYRVGFDHHALMDEMDELLMMLGCRRAERMSYRQMFLRFVGFDQQVISTDGLRGWAEGLGIEMGGEGDLTRDDWLDLLITHRIAGGLGFGGRPCFVFDYPASQCAMARISGEGLAQRFEVYLGGVELANGYYELRDGEEQRRRLLADGERRQRMGLPMVPMDERFLMALTEGLPECAGVALGLDRLLMALLGAGEIGEMLAFPVECA